MTLGEGSHQLPPNTDNMPMVLSRDIGGAEIQYLLYEGRGEDAPSMVMLHATGFLPWLWHPIARRLAPGWRIFVPYFCYHRESDPHQGGLSWLTLARDLAAFTRALDIARPAVVGHSMGAVVAAIACGAFGLDARGLVLFEPIFLPEDLYRTPLTVDLHPLASRAMRRRDSWDSEEELRGYLRSRPLFRNWDEEMLDLYMEYGVRRTDEGGLRLACAPKREASLFMGGMQYDPWQVLSSLRCPVLVLEGEESENRSFIDLEKASQAFPDGTHRIVKGAGHLIPQEKPAESLEVIRWFLETRGLV